MMPIEEVIKNTKRISLKDYVCFTCTGCGECCRQVKESVALEPLDVFKITQFLRTRDPSIRCIEDVLDRYTVPIFLTETGYMMFAMATELRYYLAVADVQIGDFSALWGNNPDNDLATPSLVRDKEKEDMIFDRLDRWIWSLENDKPPTMAGIPTKLALDSLAKIYTSSKPGLPTIEFSTKQERHLRSILAIQGQIDDHNAEIARLRERMEAHSAKIIEVMKDHEHGVLETTADKILIDFVTKPSVRTDTKKLKKDFPSVYAAVTNTSESRRLKVSVQPL